MTIGERIRKLREICAITAEDFANMVGIHPVTIRKYETGKMEPRKEHIAKICAALKLPNMIFEGLPAQYTDYSCLGDFMQQLLLLLDNGTLTADSELSELKLNPQLSRYITIRQGDEIIPIEKLSISLNREDFDVKNAANRLSMYLDMKESSTDAELAEKDRIGFGKFAERVELDLMLLEHDWTEVLGLDRDLRKAAMNYSEIVAKGGSYYDFVAQLPITDSMKLQMIEHYEQLTLMSILDLPERPPKGCDMEEFQKWETQVDFALEYYKKTHPNWKSEIADKLVTRFPSDGDSE